jgi:hypothetical protein
MGSPFEKTFQRAYRRRRWAQAWRQTGGFERRYGLIVNLGVAVTTLAVQGALGDLELPGAVLSVVLAALFVLGAVFVWRMETAPGELALAAERAHGGGDDVAVLEYHRHGMGRLRFVTHGQENFAVGGGPRVRAMHFLKPREQIVRASDLPAVVPLGRRGQLVVKAFTDEGVIISETRAGVTVEADLYWAENPMEQSIEIEVDELDEET